jgi:hypothetical protein
MAAPDEAYFNFANYGENPLRLFVADVAAALRVNRRVTLLGEVRLENQDVRAHAWYVRFRPWTGRGFDLQAGRIPPVFGAFSRRAYSAESVLIGYPLIYQSLTTLRPDSVPATVDELLRVRGRGWRVRYPSATDYGREGMPLVSGLQWDVGVEARAATERFEVSAALTNGTLSDPQVRDDNAGKQVSARVAMRPVVGLELGLSAARGPYLTDAVRATLPNGLRSESFVQQALGVDAEYSHGYWLVRGEAVISSWQLAVPADPIRRTSVDASGFFVEGRYKVRPRLFLAGRVDHLGFSRVAAASHPDRLVSWDLPISRVEFGVGCYLRRNVTAKAVYQRNWRTGGLAGRRGFPAVQLVYWF